MADVIIALLPALVWAIYLYGLRALTITAISVATCVITEYLYRKIMKKSNSIGDLSAVVTGILLAYSLPVSVPLWLPVLGSVFAIIVAKQLYGGIGKNVVNPALAGRVFLFFAYSDEMCAYTIPGEKLHPLKINVTSEINDIVAGATPLDGLKSGIATEYDFIPSLIGNIPGCIGEVSALAILIGFIYLLVRKVITWHVPVIYVGTVFVLAQILGENGLFYILSGGLMLGAVFMATDYVTSPMSLKGNIIYALCLGILTVVIRKFGSLPEGVSYSILLMNVVTPLIDNVTKNRYYGKAKKSKEVK